MTNDEANQANQGTGKPKRRRAGQTLSAQTLQVHAKQQRAVELRTMHRSLQQISDELGYRSAASAFKAIAAAKLRVESAQVEALRADQDAELVLLAGKVWAALDGADSETLFKGAAVLVRVMERRSKLHGLDAPVRLEASGDGSISVLFSAALAPVVRPELEQ